MLLGQRLSPGLMDAYMLLTGFKSQRTNEPKAEDAPDNLFEPVSGYSSIEGDFSDQARSWSL